MNPDDVVFWVFFAVGMGVWAWALVTFFKTPKAGFATGLERMLMLCLLIFSSVFGVVAWFFAVRPIINARLVDARDGAGEPQGPAAAWHRHLIP